MKTSLPWIFCDIDGTFLNDESKITPDNEEALKAYLEKGGRFSFVTGKMPNAVYDLIQRYDLKDEQFCLHGNIVIEQGKPAHASYHIESNFLEFAVDYIDKTGVECVFYLKDKIVSGKEVSENLKTFLKKLAEPSVEIMPVDDFKNKVLKIVLYLDKHDAPAELKIRNEIKYEHISIIRTGDFFLEFIPKQARKSLAVQTIMEKHSISKESCIAIGENENDIAMFEAAGHGYALQNSIPELKKFSSTIYPSNNESGVGYILQNILKNHS